MCLKATRTLNFVRRNTYCCSQEAKNIAYLSVVRPHLEYAAAAWDPWPKISSNSNEFNVVLPVLSKRLSPYNFCHWSARRTWLVALVRTSQKNLV